ncbi:MAG TPA: hypothetical protein PKA95_17065, partial [Thermomicrobiales bacterium]|nr:hypothetical protein [Thermomicrobiales bacterium]
HIGRCDTASRTLVAAVPRWGRLWLDERVGDQDDRALACHHAEMPHVQRQHPPPVPLGARYDGGVDKTKMKIIVPPDQDMDAREVIVATVEDEATVPEVLDERFQDRERQPSFDQISHLSERRGRNEPRTMIRYKLGYDALVVWISPVEGCEDGGGIEGNHEGRQLSRSHSSASAPLSSGSLPRPMDRGSDRGN